MVVARACLQLRHKTHAPFVNEEELTVLGPKEWTPYVRLHATDPGRDGARHCEVVTGPPEKKRDLLAFALPGLVVLSTGRVWQMAKRGERAYEEVAKAAVVGDVVEVRCDGIPHFLSRSKTCAEAVQEMLRLAPTSGGERAADGGLPLPCPAPSAPSLRSRSRRRPPPRRWLGIRVGGPAAGGAWGLCGDEAMKRSYG
jgi:hypothetical protein